MPEAVCRFYPPFVHDPAGEHRGGVGGNKFDRSYQVRDKGSKSIYYTGIV